MKTILLFLFFSLLSISTYSQDIQISGEKYEEAYTQIEGGEVLTDTVNFWIGLEELLTFSSPKSFFAGSAVFEQIFVGEFASVLYTPNEEVSLIAVGLTFGSEEEDVWDIMAHPPGDSLSEIGRVTVLETDTSFTVEFQKTTYELINFETGVSSVLDAQFSYQVHFDFKNDKIKYHFGESIISPEAQQKLEELSIISACLIDIEDAEGDYLTQWIFADRDPAFPDFITGFGEFEEVPPFHLKSVPEAGTVYDFSFDVITSAEERVSLVETKIFPNPGGEHLMIRRDQSSFDYEVRDAAGRLMTLGEGVREQRIETQDWPSGLYVVTIMEGDHTEQKNMDKSPLVN